jgi:hypothetical protein
MPDFRCNMLDQRGNVLFPADVVAEDLEAALRHAFEVFHKSNRSASLSERVYALEVWAGSTKLFTRELVALVGAVEDHRPAK